jgi:hypothetical protein
MPSVFLTVKPLKRAALLFGQYRVPATRSNAYSNMWTNFAGNLNIPEDQQITDCQRALAGESSAYFSYGRS